MRVACIGSRDLTPAQVTLCEKLGGWVVQCGHILDTGNAQGADQAFARGANQFRPDLVHLHLPWHGFEAATRRRENTIHLLDELPDHRLRYYMEVAEKHHPAYRYLKQGAKKLMARNSSIMLPPPNYRPVDLCLALPSNKKGGGGTGQGMRIAQSLGVRLVDLRGYTQKQLFQLCEELKT